jgi:tetratricopeptide (TPR) repeat protein
MEQEIEQLTRLIDEHPCDARLYGERGWAYYDSGQMPLAIRDFDRAIALDDREAEYRVGRGEAYRRMGYIDRPREDFDRAIELDPDYEWAYFCRAWYRSEMREHEAALADFDRVISMDPLDPFYRSLRARALIRAGEPGRALEDLDEVVRLDPENALFHYRRAETRLYYHPDVEPEEALPDLEEAIRIDPSAEWYRESRGYIRFCQGRWADAAADLACQDIGDRYRYSPQQGADLVTWVYLARLFQGEEAAGLRAVEGYLHWYSTAPVGGENAAPLAARLEYWPVPVARFLVGEIDQGQLREAPALDTRNPDLGPDEAEESMMEYHFVIGEMLLARGRCDEARPHLKAACGLPANNPKSWVSARQIAGWGPSVNELSSQ